MPVTLQGITLPIDLQWADEFAGHGVGQIITPTLTGALLVEETAQPAGRPITLQSGGDAAAATRSTVQAIAALAATPLDEGETLTLTWADGRTFAVVFDRERGAPFEAEEVMRLAAGVQTSGHLYFITLRLTTA